MTKKKCSAFNDILSLSGTHNDMTLRKTYVNMLLSYVYMSICPHFCWKATCSQTLSPEAEPDIRYVHRNSQDLVLKVKYRTTQNSRTIYQSSLQQISYIVLKWGWLTGE